MLARVYVIVLHSHVQIVKMKRKTKYAEKEALTIIENINPIAANYDPTVKNCRDDTGVFVEIDCMMRNV